MHLHDNRSQQENTSFGKLSERTHYPNDQLFIIIIIIIGKEKNARKA